MRICLVAKGLEDRNQRLQPWRFLIESAHNLSGGGHQVLLVSDGYPRLPQEDSLAGLPLVRVPGSGGRSRQQRRELVKATMAWRPDLVLWHVGLTSFLRLDILSPVPAPTIGIFTSPVYRSRELLRLGVRQLVRGWRLSAVHLVGLFVAGFVVRRAFRRGTVNHLVAECETTRERLVARGVPQDCVSVVRPGIDRAWFEAELDAGHRARLRAELGFTADDFVVGFFGPPAPLRGLPDLLVATASAREMEPGIRLLVLSRRRDGEYRAEHQALHRLMLRLRAGRWAHLCTGFLAQERVIEMVAACDVVALPFQIVPSDVPLSVLEALALGVPVITTEVACLPELVPDGAGLRVPPGEPHALAQAIHTLAIDGKLRLRLGEAARARARAWEVSRQRTEVWSWIVTSRR